MRLSLLFAVARLRNVPLDLTVSIGYASFTIASPCRFALAAAFNACDFDKDGDIDGADYIARQCNPGLDSLADWQINFGTSTSLAATTAAVAETGTWILSLLIPPFVLRKRFPQVFGSSIGESCQWPGVAVLRIGKYKLGMLCECVAAILEVEALSILLDIQTKTPTSFEAMVVNGQI